MKWMNEMKGMDAWNAHGWMNGWMDEWYEWMAEWKNE